MTALVARPDRVRLAGQRQQAIALVHFRLMLVMLLFIGITTVIAGRLIFFAVFADRAASGASVDGLLPARGDIVDRNGMPLARTIDAWSIGIHPRQLVNPPEEIARQLAALMPERSEAQYLAMLKSGRSFFYLRRRAMPELVAAVNAIGEPGIALGHEPERLYPQTSLASHVLGWTDFDGHGVSGMERVLDERLLDPAKRGQPAMLSIDSRVQAAVEDELNAAMVKHSAVGAAGLVLDVHTGEVVAMASLPTFNPNAAGKADPQALRNNVTQSVYELGSTFKAITIANAIETGVVSSMTKRYDATAPLQIGQFHIKDDEPAGRWLDVPEMMVLSSNIVTARIAEELGEARERSMFSRLGFEGSPAIELKEKGRALWPIYWGRSTVMTVGFGHGIAVTPLQLACAYAALVNGGILRPATLMKRDPGQIPNGRRVISEATSYRVRQLLRLVVMPATGGTGKKADVPGFRLGGKTGTAEKPVAGGYDRSANVATFAGVFPMDAPRYVIIMMLDSPKATADTYGFKTAGWTIAPAVQKALGRIGPMLGVQPDLRKDIDERELLPLIAVKNGPGMTAADVVAQGPDAVGAN